MSSAVFSVAAAIAVEEEGEGFGCAGMGPVAREFRCPSSRLPRALSHNFLWPCSLRSVSRPGPPGRSVLYFDFRDFSKLQRNYNKMQNQQ
jgi:hypothetical protein